LSFKYRLRTFFFLITVLPLLGAGYLIQQVFSDNSETRADTEIASALRVAATLFERDREAASSVASTLAADPDVQASLRRRNRPALREALAPYEFLGVDIAVLDGDGATLAGRVPREPAYRTTVEVRDRAGGGTIGSVVGGFALDAGRVAALDRIVPGHVALAFGVGRQAIGRDGARAWPGAAGGGEGASDGTVGDTRYRMASLDLPDTTPPASVLGLYPRAELEDRNASVRTRVIVVLVLALGIILLLSELVVRSITGQLGVFARRAREVGRGQFAGEIAVQGNDEIAQFAGAFNQMSHELEQRIEELEGERRRVRSAIARFGQALEATHDVSALLTIVVESGMETARARGGRLLIVDEQTGRLIEHLRLGTAREASEDVLPPQVTFGAGVEGRALQSMAPEIGETPAPTIAVPLQSPQAVIGLLTLVDPERGVFGDEDVEMLVPLASQGAVAIDNARMHRLITKQAATDGLTGLANHREFQDQLRREIERGQRFGLPVALILLDLDDFKSINDRFGHLAGDSVLRGVGTTLRQLIREIDTAARYGGEEYAVILPGTSVEGAARLAERIRVAVGERPIVAGERSIGVTASFGVAAMPEDGTTQVELIAAADSALYRAKNGGKNRVAVSDARQERRAARPRSRVSG
jgi:diguanylate cyclase (GGDEF)-like protein